MLVLVCHLVCHCIIFVILIYCFFWVFMGDKIDILDDVKASVFEERKMFIMRWTIISLVIIGVFAVLIVSFLVFDRHQTEKETYNESDNLDVIVQSLNDLVRQAEQEMQKDNQQRADMLGEKIEQHVRSLNALLHDGKTMYAAKAGFILASLALLKQDYSDAVYYYDKIARNMKFDMSFRDYAKFLLIQTKLAYLNETSENGSQEIDSYFRERGGYIDKAFVKAVRVDSFAVSTFGVSFRTLRGSLMLDQKRYDEAIDDFEDAQKIVYASDASSSMSWLSTVENPVTLKLIQEAIDYSRNMKNKITKSGLDIVDSVNLKNKK
jgi:tetratricopeptide (TPR) repeat protein